MPPKDSDADVHAAIELLKRKGVVFEPGLSNSEISFIEEVFGFTFPPDLRAFLQAELPVDVESASGRNPFPNWRGANRADLQARLDWPFEGIAFDVENNAFWLDDWGTRPQNLADALTIAKQHVDDAPKLIPIYSHRFLPSSPSLAGNPVLSVYQSDIIIYGRNLWDYFRHEFDLPETTRQYGRDARSGEAPSREISFWSTLIS